MHVSYEEKVNLN